MPRGSNDMMAVFASVLNDCQRVINAATDLAEDVLVRNAGEALNRVAAAEREGPDLDGLADAMTRIARISSTVRAGRAGAHAQAKPDALSTELRIDGRLDDRIVDEQILPRVRRAIQRGLLKTERK